jgi:hypothetical protein
MNKIPMGQRIFFISLIAVILLSGCKTSRKIIREPLKEQGPEYLVNELDSEELKYDWLSAKIAVNYNYDGKSNEFRGQLRVKKDSVIWLSISPALGIEVVRLIITNDSVKLLNRLNKTFFVGDFALVNKFLETNVDFDILQSIIIGNDFQFYENTSFRASIDNGLYKLSTTGRRKMKRSMEKLDGEPLVLIQNIWLDPENFKISRVDIKEYQKENKKLEAHYDQFTPLGEQLFPCFVTFQVTSAKVLKIEVNYSKVTLNEPLTFPFSIPGNYTKLK